MKRFTLIIIFSFVALSSQSEAKDDKAASSRVFGGRFAKSKEFPWLANVCTSQTSCCAGSIISSSWILTTAWCLTHKNATEFAVTLGTPEIKNDFALPGLVRVTGNVTKIHRKYSGAPQYLHNIALLKLLHAVKETEYIKYIRLPQRHTRSYAGEIADFSAWGITKEDKNCTKISHLAVVVITNGECQQSYEKTIIPSTLCTMSNKTHTTAPGDSGGSLTINDEDGTPTLIGIRSFYLQHPKSDFRNAYPTGFVRVSSYLEWIHNQTGIPICSLKNWDNRESHLS